MKPVEPRTLVYVLEDEPAVAKLICGTLEQYNYKTEHFRRGGDLLHRVKTVPAALCIVDLGLPDVDGLQVVHGLLEKNEGAVLILTGRRDVSDRVLGLEIGADDYVVKPFEPRELVARVRSVLRRWERARNPVATADQQARFADWTLHLGRHSLFAADGREVTLGVAEFQLLKILLLAPNRVLSRDYLLGFKEISAFDRSIDVRISRLRHKLERDPQNPMLIKTVYGAGYMFCGAVDWE